LDFLNVSTSQVSEGVDYRYYVELGAASIRTLAQSTGIFEMFLSQILQLWYCTKKTTLESIAELQGDK
jgi:hypothetical protein